MLIKFALKWCTEKMLKTFTGIHPWVMTIPFKVLDIYGIADL